MPRVSPRFIKIARQLLGLSQSQLASKAKVGRSSVYRIERGQGVTIDVYFRIIGAIEDAGIEFIPADGTKGEGLRLRNP